MNLPQPYFKLDPTRAPAISITETPIEGCACLAARWDEYDKQMSPIYRGDLTGPAGLAEAIQAANKLGRITVTVGGYTYFRNCNTWYRIEKVHQFPPAD